MPRTFPRRLRTDCFFLSVVFCGFSWCASRAVAAAASEAIQDPQVAHHDSWDVLRQDFPAGPVTGEIQTDVCVVGGGSAGVAAAIAAAREGAQVVLVERQKLLGGTGTNAFVAGWEPGPGCPLAEEIYDAHAKISGATGVGTRHPNVSSFPMGQWYVTDGVPYAATLQRAGVPPDKLADVPFRPEAFDGVVRAVLAETGKVAILHGTTFFRAETNASKSRVDAVLVVDGQGQTVRICAQVFVDSTGCVYLCRSAGCETMLGADPRDRFQEPSAPVQATLQLNAISRCYSIRPSRDPQMEPPPQPPVPAFQRCAHVTGWKDGVRVVNPLPTLPGRALIDFGYDECLRRSEKSARAHWHWLQRQPEFAGYELDEISPMLGIRESYRVVTQYVLNENDLRGATAPGT